MKFVQQKNKFRMWLSVVVALLLVGFYIVGSQPTPTPDVQGSVSGMTREALWTEANNRREVPLVLDPDLNQTAQKKCEAMAAANKFEHGDVWAELNFLGRRVYGENLAEGFATPKKVVEAWLGSPTHKSNLEDFDWKRVGYGVCTDERSGIVVVQQFSD